MKKIDPTLLKKAVNFSNAVIKHVSDGFERLSEDQYLVRLSVCEGDDSKPACAVYNSEKTQCRDWSCGCSIKKKAYWRSEDCPRGLWPNVSIPEDVNSQ
jgi:hypothetical protein